MTGLPAPIQCSREWYEERYREARAQLRRPQTKALRKHWQKQLWTFRACLKQYFGAEPPAE